MYTVVVPTFNRGPLIAPTLESLLTQVTAFPYEILVVDNNSLDDTRDVVRQFEDGSGGKLRYLFEAEQGSSAARNAGIAAARGEVIAFVDDDVIAHGDWLQTLAEVFRSHPDAWCVGGKVVLKLPDVLPAWFDPGPGLMTTFLSRQDLGDETIPLDHPQALISANLAVRRDAFTRVGGYNGRLGRFGHQLLCGEDIELCRRIQRAGGGVYYCGRAVVVHLIPALRVSRRFLRERAYWEGRTDALLSRRGAPSLFLRRLGREGLVMAKDWVKALARYGGGRTREAFTHELAALKRLGFLHQAIHPMSPARNGGTGATAGARETRLTVSIVRNAQGLERLADRWTALAERAGAGIFQTFEWQAAWWRSFSAGRSLYTIAVWDRDRLVGVAPFFQEGASDHRPRLVRRMRLLGCADSDYLDFVVDPGYGDRVADAVAHHLCRHTGWDVVDLEDVPADSTVVRTTAAHLTRRGCTVTRQIHHRCFAVDLPSSHENYLARLTARTRKHLRWEARKLGDAGFNVETATEGSDIEALMRQFMALHERRWAARGESGAFADARARAFHQEVAGVFHRRGWLKLAFLTRNGQPVAGEYGFQHGGRAYAYLLGLDPDSPWARFSPGMVLMAASIEQALRKGLSTYDLLRGAEPYKMTLGAREAINWRYEVVAPRLSSRLRVGLERGLREAAAVRRAAQRRVKSLIHAERR